MYKRTETELNRALGTDSEPALVDSDAILLVEDCRTVGVRLDFGRMEKEKISSARFNAPS